MKKGAVIEIICFLLILLFAYAGISKLIDHTTFRAQLENMFLTSNTSFVLSYALPLIEIFIAFLLLMPSFRSHGLYGSLVLLVLFTAYLIWMIVFKTNLPCSCGGVIALLSWKQHMLFNLFFMALSAIGIKIQENTNQHKIVHLNSLLQFTKGPKP